MQITSVKFRDPTWQEKNRVLIYLVDLTFDDCFCCRDFKIYLNADNTFAIHEPRARSKKEVNNRNYYNMSFPTNSEYRKYIEDAILYCYDRIEEYGLIQYLNGDDANGSN
jgi:DNA-binding cell septation regulator SpoVG